MEETTTSTNPNEQETPRPPSPLHGLVETGLGWARYGLSMGRQSLEASARTLETAASFLGELSDRLTARRPEEGSR